jgi:hexokinase
MADVPKDLADQIARLEELFTVPREKLKQITDRFVHELEKGLSVEGGDIVSSLSLGYCLRACADSISQ